MAVTTSTGCTPAINFQSNSDEGIRIQTPSTQGSPPGCGKVDGVAMWLINGVASAFFASLERCSCIRLATEDDIGDDANGDADAPLILNDGNLTATSSRRRTASGKWKKQNASFDDYC